jgi:hypothetical protein
MASYDSRSPYSVVGYVFKNVDTKNKMRNYGWLSMHPCPGQLCAGIMCDRIGRISSDRLFVVGSLVN